MTKEDSVTVGRGPADPASPQTPGQLLTPMPPKGACFLRPWTWGLRGFQQLKPLSPAPSTPALHSVEPVQGPEASPGPVETPLRPRRGPAPRRPQIRSCAPQADSCPQAPCRTSRWTGSVSFQLAQPYRTVGLCKCGQLQPRGRLWAGGGGRRRGWIWEDWGGGQGQQHLQRVVYGGDHGDSVLAELPGKLSPSKGCQSTRPNWGGTMKRRGMCGGKVGGPGPHLQASKAWPWHPFFNG